MNEQITITKETLINIANECINLCLSLCDEKETDYIHITQEKLQNITNVRIMQKLIEKRIFSLESNRENELIVLEQCDEYFGSELTQKDCLQIVTVFLNILKKCENK